MMELTNRDRDVLAFVCEVGQAPIDVIASRFFRTDPRNGRPNKDPLHAAERRIASMREAGFVWRASMHDSPRREPGGGVVVLDKGGQEVVGRAAKVVHAKHLHHHYQTLRMVEILRIELLKQGKTVVRVDLEDELRARVLSKGKKAELKKAMEDGPVNLNDATWAVPDAVVVVKGPSGEEEEIAVEYLSATYRDADLKAKQEMLSSSRWASCVVQADTGRTVARAQAVRLVSTVLGKVLLQEEEA
jgi:hypothetical protein